jgi:thiol-disulfide isomerase/thioredoxin
MATRKWWLRACAGGWALLAASAVTAAVATLGAPAPALIVTQLDGQEFDLARVRGKVVVVNYWASWCSPCRAEMPALDKFYQRHRGQGLVLLGLSVDEARDRAAVADIMRKFSYPAALAADAKANGFGSALAVPMTFVIDASGVVRARLVSGTAVTEQSLEQLVLPLLPRAAAAPR